METNKQKWFKSVMTQNVVEMKQIIEQGFNILETKIYLNLGYCTALHISVQKSFYHVTKFLLENGIDVNIKTSEGGYTALHLASCNKNSEIVELLLKYVKNIDQEDSIGFTPFLLSVIYNKKNNMELLLNSGADLFKTEHDGDTALHFAIDKNNVDVAEFLIKRGININIKDKHGWTALHVAAREGHKESIQFLIENNIDTEILENKNRTAQQVALVYKKPQIAEFIEKLKERKQMEPISLWKEINLLNKRQEKIEQDQRKIIHLLEEILKKLN